MSAKDIFISGIGLATPLAIGNQASWQALLAGKSAAAPIRQFDASQLPVTFACELPEDFDDQAKPHFRKRTDFKKSLRFARIAVTATSLALEDAGLTPDAMSPERVGIAQGTGMGALLFTEHQIANFLEGKRLDPLSIVKLMPNVASSAISINYGFKGPSLTVNTACASGLHAIGMGCDWIRQGLADVVIAGGVEAALSPVGILGFCYLGALSTKNDTPTLASRPFDEGRDGFVMAEGGGVVILESRKHLEARNGTAYAQVKGWSCNSEAHNLAMPLENGEGMAATMRQTLKHAKLRPSQIEHVHTHGTSTPFNDLCETQAIQAVFKKHASQMKFNSIKSMIGHTIGASGAIGAAVTALSLHHQQLPPTINLDQPDPECPLDYTANQASQHSMQHALCNSFGFGGNNSCIALKKCSM